MSYFPNYSTKLRSVWFKIFLKCFFFFLRFSVNDPFKRSVSEYYFKQLTQTRISRSKIMFVLRIRVSFQLQFHTAPETLDSFSPKRTRNQAGIREQSRGCVENFKGVPGGHRFPDVLFFSHLQ